MIIRYTTELKSSRDSREMDGDRAHPAGNKIRHSRYTWDFPSVPRVPFTTNRRDRPCKGKGQANTNSTGDRARSETGGKSSQ